MSGMGNVYLRTDTTPELLLKQLVLSPLIYLRLLSILCAIIVFGCVADKGYADTGIPGAENICLLNNSTACSFALAIGVIAFLICLVFFVKDVMMVVMDFSNNIMMKKVLIFADIGVGGLWAFMWFVAFCYTADQLRKSGLQEVASSIINCLNSVVAFSFFSVLMWGAIVGVNVFFLIRIVRGSSTGGYSGFADDDNPHGSLPDNSDPVDTKGQYAAPEY